MQDSTAHTGREHSMPRHQVCQAAAILHDATDNVLCGIQQGGTANTPLHWHHTGCHTPSLFATHDYGHMPYLCAHASVSSTGMMRSCTLTAVRLAHESASASV